MEDADGTDRFGQVLCADEDRVRTLPWFLSFMC